MKKINHPYGNTKSLILKSTKKIIQNIIRFFVGVICKLDKNDEMQHTLLGKKIKNF